MRLANRLPLLLSTLLPIVSVLLTNTSFAANVHASDDVSTRTVLVRALEGEIPLIGHEEVLEITKEHGYPLLVVNFWATWCAPCVKELPYFEEAWQEFQNDGLIVVGYCMDYEAYDEWEAAARSTIKRKHITFPNVALDIDTNQTYPEISQAWAGDLPATFLYDEAGNKVAEIPNEVTRDELFDVIRKHLPQK